MEDQIIFTGKIKEWWSSCDSGTNLQVLFIFPPPVVIYITKKTEAVKLLLLSFWLHFLPHHASVMS